MANGRTAADVFAGLGAGLAGQGSQFNELQARRRDTDEKNQREREAARQKTIYTDSLSAFNLGSQGRFDLIAQMGQRRLKASENFPDTDFSGTRQLTTLAEIAAGGGPGAAEAADNLMKSLENNVQIGRAIGVLDQGPSALDVAKTGQAEATAAKTRAETAEIGKPKPERKISAKERAETLKIIAETKKLNRLSGATPITKAEEKELEETVRGNVKRITTLSQAAPSRAAAVRTAGKFLRAFKKGQAASGSGRKFASFIPGVFTKQAQFDEELDAFAEIAAREKLKAVGEIRPTDADVEGMKRALFGIGRDETTNINLLQMFIDEQEALDDELDALRESKAGGGLATFTGLQNAPIEVDF